MVFSAVPRSEATCLFSMPSTTSLKTSRSRFVRVSSRALKRFVLILLVPLLAALFNPQGNRVQEFLLVKGFFKEIEGAMP